MEKEPPECFRDLLPSTGTFEASSLGNARPVEGRVRGKIKPKGVAEVAGLNFVDSYA